MKDPTLTSPGSIMPKYTWLYSDSIDYSHTEGKIIALRRVGVPYPAGYETKAVADAKAQAASIAANLSQSGVKVGPDNEIIALIAYLQRLGTDIRGDKPEVKAADTAGAKEGEKISRK